jgi:hypothetical protein
MLVEVNKLSSKQTKPLVQVEEDAVQILRYAATWPTASLVYKKSDMKLRIHSDASYNSEPIARSRAGGYFDLISEDNDPYTEPVNGGILAVSVLLDVVVASAGEAELGGLFINAQHGEIIRATLKDLGYPQQVTPIYTDNKCAEGIVNNIITLHKFKSMDKEDRDEAIEAAKLRKASLESLNSVIPSLLDMPPITSSVITF